MLRNIILTSESEMFEHMKVIGIDHIKYFVSNRYQIKVENNGDVKFCFIENFPISHHIKTGSKDM